ncbi:hypothetical protein FE840_008530 [Peteryoungia desertarenae]|uniref:Uncharacterized protein n=1 Tax=Peteryoungia desertarenae TaxID=1813451 RepID=A0ABX6QMX2_9HYPH|nr:hypothetical protein [Peteryoungia desertarenae]QLF69585.1 hypothetical protein FE840_008530 [Peteryoungia desertarenae]
MRIDSGLSSYSFQNRYVHVTSEKDDVTPETAQPAKARSGAPSTFSSTLISSSLASALWTVDGGRKATEASNVTGTQEAKTRNASVTERIEAAYREYDLSDENAA